VWAEPSIQVWEQGEMAGVASVNLAGTCADQAVGKSNNKSLQLYTSSSDDGLDLANAFMLQVLNKKTGARVSTGPASAHARPFSTACSLPSWAGPEVFEILRGM
jgi:hypothetical protein